MRLLVDNQLPVGLAVHLRGWGLDCLHVTECGLEQADDRSIWTFACTEGRIVVTKDEDFVYLANRGTEAGRVLWVRLGNCRNAHLLAAFDRAKVPLLTLLGSTQHIVEMR